MGKKLYVGNLPYSITDEALSEKFSECGTVDSVKIITDRDTGRSKGFGFIEMGTEDEAAAAIEKCAIGKLLSYAAVAGGAASRL